MKFRFHPRAEIEFEAAISFYEERRHGLGEEFSLEVRAAIRNILVYPRAWPLLQGDVRRYVVNRFPFGVVYAVSDDEVLILSIMNLNRHPDAWKDRH